MSNCCSGANGNDGCGMSAYWMFRNAQSFILYKFWRADTPIKFTCSLVGVFLIGFLYEGFPNLRRMIDQRLKIPASCCSNGSTNSSYSLFGQLIRSFAHACQSFYALTAMIVFMYNNGYLNIALLVGTFWGNFFFSRMAAFQEAENGDSQPKEYKGMCH